MQNLHMTSDGTTTITSREYAAYIELETRVAALEGTMQKEINGMNPYADGKDVSINIKKAAEILGLTDLVYPPKKEAPNGADVQP